MTKTSMWRMTALAGVLALSPLFADQWNKKTIITIDAPVQIPNMTLQPGTYTIKLLDSQSNRNIVTVWDAEGMKLVTTLLAIPNYRLQPTGDTKITFWETPADQPKALRAWFYPGDNFGQEFAYPKTEATTIAARTNENVPALTDSDTKRMGEAQAMAKNEGVAEGATTPPQQPATAPTQSTAQTQVPTEVKRDEPREVAEARPAPVAAAPEPTPAPAPQAAAQPEPQATQPAPQEAQPAEMPQTASNWGEVLLLGLALTGVGWVLLRKQDQQA